jgi:hypothetical protein
MNRTRLSIPEIAIIGGTRAALGAGLGLLLADRLSAEQRRAVGWTLLAVGVISTIPIAIQLSRAQFDGDDDRDRLRAGFLEESEVAP